MAASVEPDQIALKSSLFRVYTGISEVCVQIFRVSAVFLLQPFPNIFSFFKKLRIFKINIALSGQNNSLWEKMTHLFLKTNFYLIALVQVGKLAR